MLKALVERYGPGAIVSAAPYVGDDGETVRWVLEIDGSFVSDADLRVGPHPERPDVMLIFLVHGGDEVELGRWSTKQHKDGPAAILRRLRELC